MEDRVFMLFLVLSYIAIAMGLILAAYRAKSLLPVNAVGRIAFGFACTPFVVASLVTLMMTMMNQQRIMVLW